MKTKPLFGLIILSMTVQLTFSQSKTYNGSYKSSNFQGSATYSYTEQEDKRNFNGPFVFKTANNTVNISGSYLNDLKSGTWRFVLSNVANTDFLFRYLVSANVLGSFKEGNIDGNWNLTRTKVISFSNNGISQEYQRNLNAVSYLFNGKSIDTKKTTTVIEKSTANFRNNHFFGSFSYNINEGKSIVTGQFNENGYFDGIWTINYFENGILHFQTRAYSNGVLLTIKNKDNSTGSVTTIYDKTVKVNEFFQNYNSSENFSKIGNDFYKLTDSQTSENSIRFLEDAISIWYNNTSLSKSAYTFEIERGTNKLSAYPERKIIVDNVRNEKAKIEAEKIAEELRLKKEAEEEEKRLIQITKDNQEREKRYAQEKFERSDYGKLKKNIKIEFSAWLQKGEFESQQEYDTRVNQNYSNQLTKITEKVVAESKRSENEKKVYFLGSYDTDKETFLLSRNMSFTSYDDSIMIKIPRSIASDVKLKFSGSNYNNDKIVYIPKDYVLIDNTWTVSSALIVFNSMFHEETWFQGGNYTISENSNGQFVFSTQYTGFGPPPQSHEYIMKNLKECNSIGNDLYVYKWNIDEDGFHKEKSVQSTNFTFEDLGIILPTK